MKQKRIMLLGGIRYLLPVIKAAHEQGYYVITADNIPNNIAHKYSDDFANVNIVDKEAVLKMAIEKNIDGIMSFGVDPGVIAASYVQNMLGLPSFGPFESVCILQNKDRFRNFLKEHHFNVPQAESFSRIEDAINASKRFKWPVIVKPTDSAGSKGVSRVDRFDDLKNALENAMEHSNSGRIIVEDFLEKIGCSSDSDSISVDGCLSFVSFNAQRFDANASNPYAPAAYSWPSTYTQEQENYLTSEIQRLITLLGLKTAVYNIETRIAINGKPYIMEFTPRGGGNRLCEMLRHATGIDMITAITRAMVGDPFDEIVQKPYNGHWAEIILHANRDGKFKQMDISPNLPAEIIEKDLWITCGDIVNTFNGANNAIGTLVLKFPDTKTLEEVMSDPKKWIDIVIE